MIADVRLWLRRRAWPLSIGGIVLLVAVLSALTFDRGVSQGDLDPNSPTPSGSRAVAQILRAQGVDVRAVTRRAELRLANDSTLVVVRPQTVPYALFDELQRHGLDLVLVQPDAVTLDALDLPLTTSGRGVSRVAAPGCADPDATAAGPASAGGQLYRVTDNRGPVSGMPITATACYPDADHAGEASYVRLSRAGRRITVIGQADLLRNGHLAEQGNAALALRSLGRTQSVEWYSPDPLDLVGQQSRKSLGDLLPDALSWLVLQLFVVSLVVMLWRGRRLGRLVTEPLPVVVRAAETQEGRARLYRQAGGRDRAAATLRTAALRRLARRYDLGPDAGPELLADLVAGSTGRDAVAVRAALLGPPPADDAALVALADQLDAIEKDVSR